MNNDYKNICACCGDYNYNKQVICNSCIGRGVDCRNYMKKRGKKKWKEHLNTKCIATIKTIRTTTK